MLTEITGDLFATPDLDALAHGVNTIGVMGVGIAVEFKRRFPMMFHRYRVALANASLYPGAALACPETSPRWVYCLATQDKPGPHATLGWIRQSVGRMLHHAEAFGVRRVGICRVGTGYGGLRWPDVREVLAGVAGLSPVDLVVVEKR